MGPAHLPHRVTFQRRANTEDEYGSPGAAWAAISGLSRISAGFKPAYGREQVEAGRLESTMRGTLTVRRSAASAGILASDRVVFETAPYASRVANVRSIVPTPDNRHIEIVIEEGVAT
jgi:head-tail adaptor